MKTKTIKGSTTEQNLMAAFAGESQDFARYTIYAEAARAEGYEQIGRAFEDVARQELAHTRLLLGCLEEGNVRIEATYPVGFSADVLENLIRARDNEHSRWSDVYASYASTALDEGFKEIALLFKNISKSEINHEELFSELIGRLECLDGTATKKAVDWLCPVCGYSEHGKTAPAKCPLCGADRHGFTVKPSL